MASLTITKGTTKTFLLKIETKDEALGERTWDDLGTILVRIEQNGTIIEKTGETLPEDSKTLKVSFTQEDTIKLEPGKFKMQLFSIIGPEETEIAWKDDIMYGQVKPSLWSEVVHNG